jgi:hypothetical protein
MGQLAPLRHGKRDLVFQGRYRVTEDRHIAWE